MSAKPRQKRELLRTENLNYQIERELAKSVQKSLLAHQVDEQKIQDAMRFLGVVLGGMSSSFYPENEQELRVAEILGNIRQRIEKDSLTMFLARHWLTLN